MTTPSSASEPAGDGQSDSAPYLPPTVPTLPSNKPALPPDAPSASVSSATTAPDSGSELPTLPLPQPVAPQIESEPVEFDAKAMVESQKHVIENPAYGGLPKATPESIAAAKALRAKAQRKRRRNKAVGWVVAVIMLGGIGVAGWFAYQAYQDDQDQLDADRAAAQADGSAGVPGALTPLGNQQQVIEALEDVNSGATASAGGLLDAVDDAQAAVDDINGTPAAEAGTGPAVLSLLDVRPDVVARLGTQLDNIDGYERHVIDARQFAADSPTEYSRFLAVMQARPQADPSGSGFDVLPALGPNEIGFAVVHAGDNVTRAVIAGSDLDLYIDYTP